MIQISNKLLRINKLYIRNIIRNQSHSFGKKMKNSNVFFSDVVTIQSPPGFIFRYKLLEKYMGVQRPSSANCVIWRGGI